MLTAGFSSERFEFIKLVSVCSKELNCNPLERGIGLAAVAADLPLCGFYRRSELVELGQEIFVANGRGFPFADEGGKVSLQRFVHAAL